MDKSKDELIEEYEKKLEKLKRLESFSNLILYYDTINNLNRIGNENIEFIKKSIVNKIHLEIEELMEKIVNLKSSEDINSLEPYISKLSEEEKDYINKILLQDK